MIIFIAILCALAIVGVVTILNALIYDTSHVCEITVYTLNNENDIEYVIRSLKHSFPGSEIVVKDLGSVDMTVEIAQKL